MKYYSIRARGSQKFLFLSGKSNETHKKYRRKNKLLCKAKLLYNVYKIL